MKLRILLLSLVLLAGCATPTVEEDKSNLFRPTPTTAQDMPFHASGRIAVNYGGKGQYGNFNWEHSPNHDELNLLSPLGSTVAKLTRDANGVQLQSGGKTQQASDVQQLTADALGWELPLDNLSWWIRGHPAPGLESATSADGSLQQQGWKIRFVTGEPGSAVPRRVDLLREGLSIKLITDQWQP